MGISDRFGHGEECQPITAEAFAGLMAPLGPFPAKPVMAVGFSGGPDSTALAILARDWSARAGGTLVAMIVDHGLRPESAADARQAAARAAGLGIESRVLTPDAAPLGRNLQASARRMRYDLLAESCREAGVVDLLLGHAEDDQAETFLMRLTRGSGLDGLAAMAPVAALGSVRLLRPLLTAPRARLRATVQASGIGFVDDPSNGDPRFSRARLRRSAEILASEGLTRSRLRRTVRHLARARDALNDEMATLAARAARVLPLGAVILDLDPLRAAPMEVGTRLLSQSLAVASGADHPPRYAQVAALSDAVMTAPKRLTLAGCLVAPMRRGGRDRIAISRELRAIGPPAPLGPGWVRWDRRFDAFAAPDGAAMSLDALGPEGLRTVRDWTRETGGVPSLPAAVLHAAPAVYDAVGLKAAPHLGIFRPGAAPVALRLTFRPPRPITGAGPVGRPWAIEDTGAEDTGVENTGK